MLGKPPGHGTAPTAQQRRGGLGRISAPESLRGAPLRCLADRVDLRHRLSVLAGVVGSLALLAIAGHAVSAQSVETAGKVEQVESLEVSGIKGFVRIEPGASGGGHTDPAAMAELARLGYRTVVALRTATEPDANLEVIERAAADAGLTYVHIPFDSKAPDAAAIDRFLEVLGSAEVRPVFVFCSSRNRVAALWMARRLVVDGWPAERALAEARAVGLSRPETQQFVLDYAAARRP